jgi:hypothetical protein
MLTELSMVEQRYLAVREVLDAGGFVDRRTTITNTSKGLSCSLQLGCVPL